MQRALEDKFASTGYSSMYVLVPMCHPSSETAERPVPFSVRPIVVWQCYAVSGVPYPVHETQRGSGEEAFSARWSLTTTTCLATRSPTLSSVSGSSGW
jgi:hypothetical protein